MKTFKDLEFKELSAHKLDAKRAKLFFNNGYGVSVVSGALFYTTENAPYELAVIRKTDNDVDFIINVGGYLTEEEVTQIMRNIQITNTLLYKTLNGVGE